MRINSILLEGAANAKTASPGSQGYSGPGQTKRLELKSHSYLPIEDQGGLVGQGDLKWQGVLTLAEAELVHFIVL